MCHRRTDSDLLVNLVTEFVRLKALHLSVGPLFAPEHLEELLQKPFSDIQLLSLRFNPYVDRASYTIFLKGLYFDIGILKLATAWPSNPSFRSLSLVQDPIPSHADLVAAALEANIAAPRHAHAQPIVFFKLSCLSVLGAASIAANVEDLRIRIPNRSILTAITSSSTSSTTTPATHAAILPQLFPALRHLDISTTYVNCDGAFQNLFKRHPSLTHLVVDRTGLIRFGQAEEVVRQIGSLVAAIGVNRATEALKVYRAAARAQVARQQAYRQAQSNLIPPNEQNGHLAALQPSRRGRSSYATERRVRTPTSRIGAINELADALSGISLESVTIKPVILAACPSLVSLACGVGIHPDMDADTRPQWDRDFDEGWREGLQRTVAFNEEKIEEYERALARHLAPSTGKKKKQDEDDMGSVPRLYRFRTVEERRERLNLARAIGVAYHELDAQSEGQPDLLSILDLVRCDTSEARLLNAEIAGAVCHLCTIPDCARDGKIAVTDGGKGDLAEAYKWRRPISEHQPGCAHLVARSVWDSVAM